MELNTFVENFESTIDGIESGTLSSGTKFRTEIESWDSLAALSVLAMIDAEYDVIIKANEFLQCNTIEDVFNLVKVAVDK